MDNMKLLCLSDFCQGDVTAKAGDVLTIAPGAATWLLESWPACWQLIILPNGERSFGPVEPEAIEAPEVETAALEAPHADKMMRKAKAKRRG